MTNLLEASEGDGRLEDIVAVGLGEGVVQVNDHSVIAGVLYPTTTYPHGARAQPRRDGDGVVQ